MSLDQAFILIAVGCQVAACGFALAGKTGIGIGLIAAGNAFYFVTSIAGT